MPILCERLADTTPTSSNNSLEGKVAIVTGVGRGIAQELGSCGARIYVCELDKELGEQACGDLTKLGIQAPWIRCDLSRPEEAEGLAGRVVADAGRIDILVNNARSGRRAGLEDESPENWNATMAVVLQAAFFTSRGAITAMSDHGNGSIVNIASVVSDTVSNESPSYHAAKGGLVQLTRFLVVHAAPRGVRVNAVSPGFIVQSQHRKRYEEDGNAEYRGIAEFGHPIPRVGTETDVAHAVRFLASPDAAWITGQCLRVDGGVNLRETSDVLFDFASWSNE